MILLNLISLNNNIAQFDDRAVRRPRGATTARHDRAGWTGKNVILDEALSRGLRVKRDADRRRMTKIPKLAGPRVSTTLNKQPRDLVRSAAFFNLTQI